MKTTNLATTALLALLTVFTSAAIFSQSTARTNWYRGNTHTHTLDSDGDTAPDDVVRWYRENGYNFVFITDHEYITNVGPLNHILGKPGVFLVISGQEVTDRFDKSPFISTAWGSKRW